MTLEPSLADLFRSVEGVPLQLGMLWALAKDHDERFGLVERMMDACYLKLVDVRHLYHDKSEDELTVFIVAVLQSLGVQATHDTQVGGHCDVLITGKDGFLWIGEAKRYSGYTKLLDGFLQLSTRYGVAQPGRNRGEVIIYFPNKNALEMMKKWQLEVSAKIPGVNVVESLLDIGSLSFRTSHACPTSGCAFGVRHRAVPINFEPEK